MDVKSIEQANPTMPTKTLLVANAVTRSPDFIEVSINNAENVQKEAFAMKLFIIVGSM